MPYSVDDLVDYALSDDAVKAGEAMDELMVDRVNDAIETRKFALVNSVFNGIDVSAEVDPLDPEDEGEQEEGEGEEENEEGEDDRQDE